jgi:hypothetical protein
VCNAALQRLDGPDLPVIPPAVILDLMSKVTRILGDFERGEQHAAEQLLPLVYEELRRLALEKWLMKNWPDAPGHRAGPRGVPAVGGHRKSPALG